MREILFRGKDFSGVINHNWCFGCLDTTENDRAIIIYSDRFGNKCRVFVDPKTVGQYTGLNDKNGKKIFEGDIVRLVYNGNEHIYQVVYDVTELDFKATNGREEYGNNFQYLTCCEEVEVIGNINDNPELLRSNAE
nr:MAG TPA: YopX protein [Caudoviricetes sp.]